MSYVEKLLAKDEFVLLKANRHPVFMLIHIAPVVLAAIGIWILAVLALLYSPIISNILGIVLILLSLVPLGIALYRYLYWRNEQYVITTYRILQVEGIANRRTFDSALEMVNDVEMHQPLIGRFLNYGSIDIITGSDIGLNELTGIANPFEFKRALIEAKLAFSDHRNRPHEQDLEFKPDKGEPELFANDLSKSHTADTRNLGRHDQDTSRLDPVTKSTDQSRIVIALTELRNAGMLSDSEFDEKMRAIMRD